MALLDAYGRALVAEQVAEERLDAWANQATGLGVWGLDKTKAASYLPVWRVLDQELTNLYNGSDVAKKIVGKRPEEMFRRGFDIEADNVPASKCDEVREYATEELDLETNMREAMRWSRLYGGGLLCLGVDDGRFPWEPLDENNIKSFESLSFVDRRYAYVQSQYATIGGSQAKYGQAEVYLISNAVAGYGWNSSGIDKIKKVPASELQKRGAMVSLWHETRVIRFDGNPADIVTKQNLAGWSWSVLQVVYEAMRQFDGSFDSAAYLLSDASQGVLKLQGLFKAITAGQRGALANRAMLLEQTRSVLRSIVLDKEEDFTRIATPFGGIPELLDRMMLRLASAADMPATELFGRAPAGMNATGENDTRKWYDTIESEQKNDLGPRLKRIFRLLALTKDGPLGGKKPVKWTVKFRPLWSPTDQELAQTRLATAQRDQIYIGEGVVKPEEVAVDLSEVYPNLDVDAREAVLTAGVKFDPYENEPAPEAPALIAGKSGGQEPLSPETPVPLTGQPVVKAPGAKAAPGGEPAVAKPAAGKPPAGKPPAGKPPAGKPQAPPVGKPAPPKPAAKAQDSAAFAGELDDDETGTETDEPDEPAWIPRGERGKFGRVLRHEVVETPHGQAHTQLAVAPNGEHRFAARARKPDGTTSQPMEVRISSENVLPDVLLGEATAKRRTALSLSLPSHTRAQAHALSESLDAHALRLRRDKEDFNEGQERVPAGEPDGGQFTSGGGGGGSKGGGERHGEKQLSEHGKQWLAKAKAEGKVSASLSVRAGAWLTKVNADVRSFFTDKVARAEAFHAVAHSIHELPKELTHKIVEGVKHNIRDVKLAGAGIRANLHGQKMSPEQKTATKKVAAKLAIAVAAHFVAGGLPVHWIASEVGRKVAEQIGDHLVEKGLERAAAIAGFEIEDALEGDELEQLLTKIAQGMAAELEEMASSGDVTDLIERIASNRKLRADYDPERAQAAAKGDAGDWEEEKHPRGPDGKFGEGGGGSPHAAKARELAQEAVAHGGFTYRPGASTPKDGYIVSHPPSEGLNRVLEIKDLAAHARSEKELLDTVGAQIAEHMDKVMPFVEGHADTYLGGYMEKDEADRLVALHLDVNEHHTDREKAIGAGKARNQISIWDLGKGAEIKTGGTGRGDGGDDGPKGRARGDAGGDWEEEKHPRGPDGKFGEGGGAPSKGSGAAKEKATADVPVKQLIEALPAASASAPGGEDPLMGASSGDAFESRSRERTEGAEPSSVAAVRDFTAGGGFWREVRAYEKDPEGWSRAHLLEAADVKQVSHNVAQFFREAQPTPGLVYRGMAADDAHVRALLEHDTLTMPATSSTAREAGIAMSFVKMGLYDRPGDHPVVLRLRQRSGVAIEHISNQGEGEREVLLPKGTSFRITSRSQTAGYLIIDAEEISR